ncbi:MAG: YcxB family protein [Clostridium sp.]|nr:YcxB family protein [Clostridium sp.]
MKFQYTYRNTAAELWQLSMYYTYGSLVGLCNIIFTAAVVVMGVSRWPELSNLMRGMVLLCGLLFTVIQPIAVYRKARKQASGITADTSVGFDDEGVHVGVGDKNSVLKWSNVKKISRKPTMIVIFSDTTHGFVLSNRVLGADREAFYNYVASKMKK